MTSHELSEETTTAFPVSASDALAYALLEAWRTSERGAGAPHFVVRRDDGRLALAEFGVTRLLAAVGGISVIAEVRAKPGSVGTAPSFEFPSHVPADVVDRFVAKLGDPAWAAALYILTFSPIAERMDVWRHVEPDGIDWSAILDGTGYLSGGERRLLAIAAACFNSDHPVALGWAMSTLSYEWRERALLALRLAAGD